MDINLIARTIEQNIQGERLVFSDETTGVPYIMKLFYYHMEEQNAFEMTKVTCGIEQGVLHLSGRGMLPDGTDCHLELLLKETADGNLEVEMPRQYLLTFPGIKLGCIGIYKEHMWNVIFEPKESVQFGALIAESLNFLGLPVGASCFGELGTVKALRFQLELPFEETGLVKRYLIEQDNFTNIKRENYFSLYFETDIKLDLSKIFAGEDQAVLGIKTFQLEKFGARCGFSFRGSLKIWRLEIPFTIRYDEQMLRLTTTKDEKRSLKIPSIKDLGKLVGIETLNFPDSLSSLTAFEVDKITLTVSPDVTKLVSFEVVVSNQNTWQIAQTPDIHITNLVAGFTKKGSEISVFIGGDFCIDTWIVTLSAIYQKEAGWIFRCYIANDLQNPLDLSQLFKRICAFLGLPEIPFLLPELKFVGAMVSFQLDTKQFTTEMEIGKMLCKFDFRSVPKQSHRLDLAIGYEISLAGLPIVGTDLHLLDHMMIRNMNLTSDANETVFNLEFGGKVLKLELAGKKPVKGMLRAANGAADNAVKASGLKLLWFNMEQKCSIFTIHRIGIGFDGQQITFAFDAELSASAFEMAVEGMAITLSVKERLVPSFHLSGLSVGFHNSALRIGGGFWHAVDERGRDSYDGALTIAVKGISILVAGSYSDSSFLAYGILRGKIGGPPAFSITGLAVGFGLNNYLKIPKIEEVGTYPLVAAAIKPDYTVQALLAGIKSQIAPSTGQNFLAAGIRFQSFGIVDSFALLTVSFGKHLEIALLGLSNITVPPLTEKDAIAKATLALKATLLPELGVLSVEAQLMSDSYILSRSCRLTGGFAFYLWFGGKYKGDFVITLGGYKKGYPKPAHYPDVPRLGFCWCVTPMLVLRGEMYFALTPSALCAGGKLEAVFQQGPLRAWFTAYADMELGWKPFYYELAVGVSLGASITLDLWLFSMTFTLEMSVDLHIKGPDFGGRARITWWVISFTISFGEDVEAIETIEWEEFKKTFLQEHMISIQAAEGKTGTIKVIEQGEEKEIEVLNAEYARLTVESLIPSSKVMVNGTDMRSGGETPLGVLPLGTVSLSSPFEITVSEVTADANRVLLKDCETELITQNVPKALWAKEKKTKYSCEAEQELILNAVTGACLQFQKKTITTFPKESFLTLDMLSEYEKIQKQFSFRAVLMPDIVGKDTDFQIIQEAAGEMEVKVSAFAKEMKEVGFAFDFKPSLTRMTENAKTLFDEEVMIWGGGRYGALDGSTGRG